MEITPKRALLYFVLLTLLPGEAENSLYRDQHLQKRLTGDVINFIQSKLVNLAYNIIHT